METMEILPILIWLQQTKFGAKFQMMPDQRTKAEFLSKFVIIKQQQINKWY